MSEEATRRITKFNFESEGAHVALVDAAANLQEVLVMKSADPVKDDADNKEETLEVQKEAATEEEVEKSIETKEVSAHSQDLEILKSLL